MTSPSKTSLAVAALVAAASAHASARSSIVGVQSDSGIDEIADAHGNAGTQDTPTSDSGIDGSRDFSPSFAAEPANVVPLPAGLGPLVLGRRSRVMRALAPGVARPA